MDKLTIITIIHFASVMPIQAALFYWFLKSIHVTTRLLQRAIFLAVISYVIGWVATYISIYMSVNPLFGILINVIAVALLLTKFLVLPKMKIWLASTGIVIGGQLLAGIIVMTTFNNLNLAT